MLPECLLDEDTLLRVETLTWLGPNLHLLLKSLNDDALWELTCEDVSDWRILDRVTEGLWIADDHPVLWGSQFLSQQAYFQGVPANPLHAACDVLTAIAEATRRIEVLAPAKLASLLATGNGSIGYLPLPVIPICAQALAAHNVRVYHLGEENAQKADPVQALLFGNGSFVVAKRFAAEQRSQDSFRTQPCGD